MKLVVYLDLLILINLLMNYILLWATAKMSNLTYKIWRLLLTSLLGTGYTILVIWPGFGFLNKVPIHLLVSGLMIVVAFGPLDIKEFCKALSYFYLITFVTAGAMFALNNLTGQGPLDSLARVLKLSPDNLWLVIYGCLIATVIGKFGWKIIQHKLLPNIFHLPIEIFFGDQNKRVKALVDTGNRLQDPLTNTPVIVVEVEVIKELMPKQVKELFYKYDLKEDHLFAEVINTPWADRFRLIPFSSLGEEEGMLIGFRPDKVTIKTEEKTITTQQVIIALYNHSLDGANKYQALLNPDLFQAIHW